VPHGARCLCCCTTNKAVDSLVEKLVGSGLEVRWCALAWCYSVL
jgi:hypothetical protein